MEGTGTFRARRPPSPPPITPPIHAQRFPYAAKEHLDADERRAAASKGSGPRPRHYFPPGGLRLTVGEWKLLAFVMVIAAAVRLYRLSRPNSVVCVLLILSITYVLLTLSQLRRSSLWQVRLQVHQDVLLRRCPPAPGQTPYHPRRLHFWL